MKAQRILIDANVAYTYLSGRDDPFSKEIIELFNLCQKETFTGYIAFHSVSILWFIMRKMQEEQRRIAIKEICTLFTVVSASHEDVINAISNRNFKDFEDCLQYKCAGNAFCDYIVTSNIKDYTESTIPAVTPKDILAILASN